MFQGLFNYDNPVWRFIGKLGDLVLLNLLWLICCIPVFTAGAATTAVYYVTLKLVRDDDGSTIKSFFHSFTQNFKQATAIWLFVTTYIFPLQARFYNTVKRTLFNAFFMSVRHLLQTISMLIIDGLVVAGVYVALYMVPQVSMLLLLFGFPLIAFINSYFFTEIFKKYIPKEEDQEHSNGISPLLDENNQEIEDAIQSLKGK